MLLNMTIVACGEKQDIKEIDYCVETSMPEEIVTVTKIETPKPIEQVAPESSEAQNLKLDISYIPFFSDSAKFLLSTRQALVYVEAIRSAEVKHEYWGWGHLTFDKIYPVFLDISGDGVPLLLIVEKDDMYSWDIHWNLLFGFKDGELQQITKLPTGIGIATLNDERLLALVCWSDFGGWICLYRVQHGAAVHISSTHFKIDRHNNAFYIDDVEAGENEFWEAMEELSIKHLMATTHPGTVNSLLLFEKYLYQSFSREQVMQMFKNYANGNDGVIHGDIYYNDIAISRLFEESFIDVLGEPLSIMEAFYNYEGLVIMELEKRVAQIVGFMSYSGLFKFNDVALSLTRAEVIDMFGIPYRVGRDGSLRYFALTCELKYCLTFRFEDPYDITVLTSITILPPQDWG